MHVVFLGNSHMSPGVLATMWKDQEIKTRAIESRMTSLLEERGVGISMIKCWTYTGRDRGRYLVDYDHSGDRKQCLAPICSNLVV